MQWKDYYYCYIYFRSIINCSWCASSVLLNELCDIKQDHLDQHQPFHVSDIWPGLQMISPASESFEYDVLYADVFDVLSDGDADVDDFTSLVVEVALDNTHSAKMEFLDNTLHILHNHSPIVMFDDRRMFGNYSEEIVDQLNSLRDSSVEHIKKAEHLDHAGTHRGKVVSTDLSLKSRHEQILAQSQGSSAVRADIKKNVLKVDGYRQIVEVAGWILHSKVDLESVELLVA